MTILWYKNYIMPTRCWYCLLLYNFIKIQLCVNILLALYTNGASTSIDKVSDWLLTYYAFYNITFKLLVIQPKYSFNIIFQRSWVIIIDLDFLFPTWNTKKRGCWTRPRELTCLFSFKPKVRYLEIFIITSRVEMITTPHPFQIFNWRWG